MKRWLTPLLAVVACIAVTVALGTVTGGVGGLAYVVSGSMEPTLHIGDGFVLAPAGEPKVGDVITFLPVVLEADRVTHRIVGTSSVGFVTQGDANPTTDQELGEPLVPRDRVIGKAVVVNHSILRIPGLGTISQSFKSLIGTQVRTLAGVLAALGLLMVLFDRGNHLRRPTRRRWRLGHLYWGCCGLIMLTVLAVMLLGSRVQPVDYLVSMNPGTLPFHVRAGEAGTITVTVQNLGLFPVYHFSSAIGAAEVVEAPEILSPRSKETVSLRIPAQTRPGWYKEYVRVSHLPMLMPRPVIATLFQISPYVAMAGILVALGLGCLLVSLMINTGTPLAAYREKVLLRMTRRALRPAPTRRRST